MRNLTHLTHFSENSHIHYDEDESFGKLCQMRQCVSVGRRRGKLQIDWHNSEMSAILKISCEAGSGWRIYAHKLIFRNLLSFGVIFRVLAKLIYVHKLLSPTKSTILPDLQQGFLENLTHWTHRTHFPKNSYSVAEYMTSFWKLCEMCAMCAVWGRSGRPCRG